MVGLGTQNKIKKKPDHMACANMYCSSTNVKKNHHLISAVFFPTVFTLSVSVLVLQRFGCKVVQHWGTDWFKVSGHQRGWKVCSFLGFWFFGDKVTRNQLKVQVCEVERGPRNPTKTTTRTTWITILGGSTPKMTPYSSVKTMAWARRSSIRRAVFGEDAWKWDSQRQKTVK